MADSMTVWSESLFHDRQIVVDNTLGWLLEGDPVIRWQTLRDLAAAPHADWEAERSKTVETGWGAGFLEALQPDGTWPKGRWTDTVWTLLLVMDCGLPSDHPRLRDAAHRFLDEMLSPNAMNDRWLLTRCDLCHLGFWLRIGAYFDWDAERLRTLADVVLKVQMADGGWNCQIRGKPKTTRHSSFHTTFNVLEGLRPAMDAGIVPVGVFQASEARALEFMLMHKMYRSDHTGLVINERFTHLSFPSHWHYTVLRGLDYMRLAAAIADPRLDDPIEMLFERRNSDGRWVVEKRIPGVEHVDMEKMGGPSRWNTLRMLRVLAAQPHREAIP